MRKTTSKLLSVLLALGMMFALLAVPSFAKAEEESAQETDVLADVLGALDSVELGANVKLYVKADAKNGLPGKIKVCFGVTDADGALCLPGNYNGEALYFSWSDPDLVLSKNGKTYESGKAPAAKVGETVTYQVQTDKLVSVIKVKTVKGSAGVDAIYLNLDESLGTIEAMNKDPDHETSCYGKAKVDGKTQYISIKGRGNSTWSFPKKPYNITFYKDDQFNDKKKTELIDGVKSKKWSLVANHLDNSLMRNKIAMDLADSLGIGMKTKFVDLWMNGDYLGNYLLTPKNDYASPDGGYSLENDNYIEPEDQFMIPNMTEIGDIPGVSVLGSGYHNRISIKDIGDDAKAAGATNETIEKHFLKAWAALEDYDSEDYQKYFDIDSWARMYLMYEVSKTYDCYAGSILMHRDGLSKSDKLIAGPAWDYDVSFGRTLHKFFIMMSEPVQVNAEGWYVDSIGVQASNKPISLLQELGKHQSFREELAKVYQENRAVFESLPSRVDAQRAVLKDSALMNNERWGTNNLCAEYVVAPNTMRAIGTGKYKLNYEVTLTWDNYVNNLKEFCTKRVLWLGDHLS